MLSARDVCRLLSVGPRRHAASIFPYTPQISAADAREGRHGTFQPNAGAAVAPVFSLLYGVHTHKTLRRAAVLAPTDRRAQGSGYHFAASLGNTIPASCARPAWSSIRELNSHPQFGRLMCCRYTNAAGCSPFYTAAGAFLTVTQSRASQPGAPKCLRPSASADAYMGDAFLKKEEIHYAAARYAQTHSVGMGFGIGPKRWGDKAPKRTCSHRVPGECPELRAAAGVLAAVQDCDGQSTSILRFLSVDGRLLTIPIARSAGNRSLFFPGFL